MTLNCEKKKVCINVSDLEFQTTIGKGKTSCVRTARIVGDDANQLVAVKQFRTYPTAMSDLQNEVSALNELSHDNIIRMLASDNKNIVLEYHPRGELFEFISCSKLSERIAKTLFKDLISAVSYIHGQNWAHRDIKLENILITEDMHIVLADFGFATKTEEGKTFERSMGTEGYMAPELQARQKYCAKKADVFALGVVLFSMVNGMPPFFKAVPSDPYYKYFFSGNQETYWANLSKKYANTLSSEFKDLMGRMLNANSSERISIDDILSHPWMNNDQAEFTEVSEFMEDAISGN